MPDAETGTEWLAFHKSPRFLIGYGENLWNFYPLESFDGSTGDHLFSCYIKVVDNLSAVDEAAFREEVSADEPFIYPPETFESSVRLIRIGLFMDIKQVALQGHGTNLLKFLWKAFRLGIAKNVLAS